jgi:hypothetical protein
MYDGEADTYVYKGKLIFEVDNASGIFGLLDYFRKYIFLYFEQFLSYLGFCVQKFEKWPF